MNETGKKVVIVEDEPDTAEMFAEMMRVNGYRVLTSHTSIPAINLISADMPDIVILDIMMPDISGLEVLRYIRRDPRLSAIPVIIVSARTQPADIKEGLNAGANAYLTKPVKFLDLKQSVDSAIAQATAA